MVALGETTLRLGRPVVYQEAVEGRRGVDGRFAAFGTSGDVYGFEVGVYNRSQPLVLDPVLEFSTYLGGETSMDQVQALAVDGSGNVYVGGTTWSTDFPMAPGVPCVAGTCAFQLAHGGGASDGFVAVVVWQQHYPTNPSDHDVWAKLLGPATPANDARAAAATLTPPVADRPGTLAAATSDGASSCGKTGLEPDVWYRFTAPAAGTLHVNTCGTNDRWGVDTGPDTVLSLHGAELPGGCNDDAPSGNDPLNPDAWNPGKTQADSTTGLTLDAYPFDTRLAFPPYLEGVYPLLLE